MSRFPLASHLIFWTSVAMASALLAWVGMPRAAVEADGPAVTTIVRPATIPEVDNRQPLQNLPLKKVVIFDAGIAYFEHAATVEGDVQVQMKFSASDINDLLKSLIVRDSGGGAITLATYESQAPVSHVLETFAIDLADNPSLKDLLEQLRGVDVRISGPEAITGTIVSVETHQEQLRDKEEPVTLLNVRTAAGLKHVPLERINSLQIDDDQLDREFQQALQVLRQSMNTEKKSVVLHFSGKGSREIRLGYIQEAPVWKMSYRLVLVDDGNNLLQGWSIVENLSPQDWQDIRLSLVSGQPISFIAPLYSPMFVNRPEVQLDLYAGLRPPTYQQALGELQEAAPAPTSAAERARLNRAVAGGAQKAAGFVADRLAAKDLKQSVQSQASLAEVGKPFEFKIEAPVTIPRMQSATIPIVNQNVPAEKLSIYEQSVLAKHPLHAVRLTNTTDTYLQEGPVTVIKDGVYAGDAILEGTSPGSDRLVSYAVDLDVEIAPQTEMKPQQLVSVRIDHGTLYIQRQQLREQQYVIKNSGDKQRTVLVQIPKDPGWELESPTDRVVMTRDSYRIEVQVPEGKTQSVAAQLKRKLQEQIVLTNAPLDTILIYASAPAVSDEAKKTLREIADRQKEIAGLNTDLEQAQKELNEIAQDQQRIRQNMEQVQRDSELYARYVTKLGNQEDSIEQLRQRVKQLQEEIKKKRVSLDDYIQGIEIT